MRYSQKEIVPKLHPIQTLEELSLWNKEDFERAMEIVELLVACSWHSFKIQVTEVAHVRVGKWFEGMLKHGAEGVRQIEAHVTNTMGWSATTGQVDPWVYQRISETFVLDEDMRKRLAALNPEASVRMANRLLEASDRAYWTPDDETLAALQGAADDLEDQMEGIAAE